jgi:hypothetical protein
VSNCGAFGLMDSLHLLHGSFTTSAAVVAILFLFLIFVRTFYRRKPFNELNFPILPKDEQPDYRKALLKAYNRVGSIGMRPDCSKLWVFRTLKSSSAFHLPITKQLYFQQSSSPRSRLFQKPSYPLARKFIFAC